MEPTSNCAPKGSFCETYSLEPPRLCGIGEPLPDTVKYNVTRDKQGRLIVHLINYADSPCEALTIAGEFEPESAELFSPDQPAPQVERKHGNVITTSNVLRYAVVRFNQT